ncbi:family 1 glycosylhydrolase [Streptantibioticus ferralitis]|uniref:Family 1 glycosylhydrolase n=1 Tax=Streptantibioticus ferralitis TaxID=236510 RepID=A0ABT5YSH2_9ACTN|nr:family 1 glycosylhydrolase [Streptantibioticus ferralitis]MDF2254379.1 family 1 glycosylhydrolase [Streptantibioticus ferralitis]
MTTSVPGPSGFPAGFSWGTASSATQSQGATPADNWWGWEQAGKAPRSGDGNGFDRLYASDFSLLADWGFSDYRVSLDWARIEPQPGQHDRQAIEHYRQVLLAGRDAGLTMWVCLLHTALPAWFAAEGGFLSPTASDTWLRHVDFIAETFGDLADGWMPVNNPTAYAQKAYLAGTFPPGHTSQEEFLTALQAIHQADFEAALRLRQGGKPTSTNEALLQLHPVDDSDDAAAATALVDAVVWGSWLNMARTPRYEGAFDRYGFSYYFTAAVNSSGDLLPYPAGERVGPQGYASWAPGLGEVLTRLDTELPGKRFLVAEIGYGGDDDTVRAAYLQAALDQVRDAVARGMGITGVHFWTGVDNYEWLNGYGVPFGLFDRNRVPRPSARIIQSLIRR